MQHRSDGLDRGHRPHPKCLVQLDLVPPTLSVVVQRTTRYGLPEHLLQTERLRTQLEIGVRTTPTPNLVLNRERPVRPQLDHVGLTAQTVSLRPERDTADGPNTALHRRLGSVGPFVSEAPTNGE